MKNKGIIVFLSIVIAVFFGYGLSYLIYQVPDDEPAQEQSAKTEEVPLPAADTIDAATSDTSPAEMGKDVATVNVYFSDLENYANGVLPYERAVKRTFKTSADLKELVLIDLFEGPDATEQADGLHMVYSGATGALLDFDSNTGVATVTLQGGCNNNGATYTVANLIFKNLEQFDEVKHIVIKDSEGTTEDSSGKTNSIPTCLEP